MDSPDSQASTGRLRVGPLRPGLREDARPLPRRWRWSLLCPWAVVRRVLHLPLSCVPSDDVRHLHHVAPSGNCSGDAGLLVSPPRAHPPLPPSLGSSRRLPVSVHQTRDTKKGHS